MKIWHFTDKRFINFELKKETLRVSGDLGSLILPENWTKWERCETCSSL